MGDLSSHRRRRLFASGSPILLAGGTAMIGAAIAILNHSANDKSAPDIAPGFSWVLLIAAIIGVVLLLMEWQAEYRRRTYDPKWALKFQDDFLSEEMLEIRSMAAKALKQIRENETKPQSKEHSSPEIDEVLDFFEDLGFYMKGDQITPEVTYHAFYFWIRGYYSAAREYINCKQKKQPAQWASIKGLFETMDAVEIEKSELKTSGLMDAKELKDFLADEIHVISTK